jgi:S-adenosylmethionine decarboxylase
LYNLVRFKFTVKEEGDVYALGKHVLLELKQCNREVLEDIGEIREILLMAAERAKAKVVGESFHQFSPQGVSGVVIIAESHLSIHTWPEWSYAAVDIFTCGDSVNVDEAVEFMTRSLSCQNLSVLEISRGIVGSHDAQG